VFYLNITRVKMGISKVPTHGGREGGRGLEGFREMALLLSASYE